MKVSCLKLCEWMKKTWWRYLLLIMTGMYLWLWGPSPPRSPSPWRPLPPWFISVESRLLRCDAATRSHTYTHTRSHTQTQTLTRGVSEDVTSFNSLTNFSPGAFWSLRGYWHGSAEWKRTTCRFGSNFSTTVSGRPSWVDGANRGWGGLGGGSRRLICIYGVTANNTAPSSLITPTRNSTLNQFSCICNNPFTGTSW